jgi:hypothetical protein
MGRNIDNKIEFMSYDLHFYYKGTDELITLKRFLDYFQNKPNYEIKDTQAAYYNEDTGVYFSFDYINETSEDEPIQPDGHKLQPISFNINFYRPHIFALEAEKELKAFIQELKLLVSDPQTAGMGDDEYTTIGFVSGWNHGNEIACKSLIKKENQTPLSLPTEEIEQYWNWNYNLKVLEQYLQIDIFVPRYMFIMYEKKLEPVIVWTDGIPIALPEVKKIVIYRKELAPRKITGRKPDMAIVNKSDIESFLSKYPVRESYSTPYHFLNYSYQDRPSEILNYFRSLPTLKGELEGIPVDHILNNELIEKYTSK